MDNQNLPNQYEQNQTKKNSAVKILFTVLGVIIVIELIWAVFSMVKKPTQLATQTPVATVTPQQVQMTTLSLIPDKTELKVGDKINVEIKLNTDINTDGTDVVIIYDPKLLTVDKTSEPVQVTTLYSQYPQNIANAKLGRVTVSGVAGQKGGILANGVFGSVQFSAKAAGKTNLSIDFTPASTIDSNVIESSSGKDILEKVENAEITIIK